MNKMLLLFAGVGLCTVVGTVLYLGSDEPGNAGQTAGKQAQTVQGSVNQAADDNRFASIWGKAGAEPSGPEKKAIIDDLWARAMTPAEKLKAGDDAQDKLRKLAQSDPEVLKNLLGRYGKDSDPLAKEMLMSLLSTIESPETLAFSKKLAVSGNAEQRKDGLAMLQNLSADSREVRDIVKQTLATEQTPGVLVAALAALRPSEEMTPAETEAIVTQLKGLAQNADPAVRSQTVLQLAQWDKSGAGISTLSQALTDPAHEVRQAAVFAIGQTGTQSDSAKSALLNVINNANENKDVRASALQILEQFKLSKEDTEKYSQLRSQLMGQ